MLQPETKARCSKGVSEYRNFCCRGRLPRIMSKSAEEEQKEERVAAGDSNPRLTLFKQPESTSPPGELLPIREIYAS